MHFITIIKESKTWNINNNNKGKTSGEFHVKQLHNKHGF